jgi:hypothetical protein
MELVDMLILLSGNLIVYIETAMAKLVYAPHLGCGGASRLVGSSPASRTRK